MHGGSQTVTGRMIVGGVLLCLAAVEARADLTVAQVLEYLAQGKTVRKEQITLYVSGLRIRLDQGPRMSSIILNDKRVTYSLMHELRQYAVLPHDQIKPDPAEAKNQPEAPGDLVIESTGATEQIGGFSCRQVRIKEKNGATTELWIADQALDMNVLLNEFRSLMDLGFAQLKEQFEKRPELRGFPMRIVEYKNAQLVRQATVSRFDLAKIPDSIFEVPAGYSEMKIPQLPATPTPGPAAKDPAPGR